MGARRGARGEVRGDGLEWLRHGARVGAHGVGREQHLTSSADMMIDCARRGREEGRSEKLMGKKVVVHQKEKRWRS